MATPQELSIVNDIIRNRRSVFPKDYSGERVDDAIIWKMLENANWAPNHKLTQPWRFVVFTGDGLKKLADLQSECYRTVSLANQTFDEKKFESLKTKPLQSSHIIAVGMKRDEAKRLPEWEELGAVFCAIENMYLTATAAGVGCYLSTGGITGWPEANALFGWGAEDKLLGFLHVGMIASSPVARPRTSVEEKVVWVNQ